MPGKARRDRGGIAEVMGGNRLQTVRAPRQGAPQKLNAAPLAFVLIVMSKGEPGTSVGTPAVLTE